ncbi:carboxymuconolactone decarboxylase family protein [Planctomyces sp. SH-PL62]|uniref:carboxymuconolactone decarboxylase family protein n=1 Tax=Planctomyces sp. SH-PL62 TaxID=1636152 RepID=UPI00078EDB1C|nr:carboxymuconolactone decarboxylase family protein [Planctomyces sp. SH-PL62]AMV38594.1 Carboxymuconolactone decarboxylase family protein [Planctomyces sp. SH-PL62]
MAASSVLAALSTLHATAGDESPSAPSPVAVTRPGLKQVLEGSKQSKPRLPLPPLTEEDKARAEKAAADPKRGVFAGIVNNGRMRNYYLAPEFRSEFYVRPSDVGKTDPKSILRMGAGDPAMPLDPTVRIMFFWLVARANNCYYCLGHQEVKLKAAGVTDDQLAALDTDWSAFPQADAAAFAFVKTLAKAPQEIADADLDALRGHHDDLAILDMIFSTGNYCAMTRWTGGLAIPQEDHRDYLTPTAAAYRELPSLVAPLDPGRAAAQAVCKPSAANRPALESRSDVEARLAAARDRKPRLPLVEEEKARKILPDDWSAAPLPNWVRLLANFPEAGKARIVSLAAGASADKGVLDPTLRAQIAWIAARQDRAWYALGHAKKRLQELGQSDDAIFALDAPDDRFTPGQKAAFHLARKLTVDPAMVTDADVEAVRKHYNDRETAEVVYFVTVASFFGRVTEAAGLPLEF